MESLAIGTLTVRAPDGIEQLVPLKINQSFQIGRDENNDIVIKDPAVSRIHASITVSENGVVLSDLNSLNGVYINGERLGRMKDLSAGDSINIGGAKITLSLRSNDIAESLSSSSSSRAMTAQLKPVAVSCLLSSIRDYNQFCSTLPTSDITHMLVNWCQEATKIIKNLGGTVDKVIEQNIVAIWLGTDEKQQAINAVDAAQRILKMSDELAQEIWVHQMDNPWRVTAVLNSGQGLMGVVGANSFESEKRFTMIGDPINRTFELESSFDKLETSLIVSNSTAALVKDAWPLSKINSKDDDPDKIDLDMFSL